MDYRILNVIVLILAARYVRSCNVFYDKMSCTYTETCEGQLFDFVSWQKFVVPNYEVAIINEETCLEPFEYNGYRLYPVHFVLRTKYDTDNIPSMPPVNNYYDYNDGDNNIILNIIYSLDLSNNGYSQSPIIRSTRNLVKLNLSNNLLTSAVLSNPNVLNKLSEIDLSYNMISFIELRDDEHPYVTLNIINLSHNFLNQLPDGIFGKFANLQKLDLSYNNINILSLSTFENVKHVTDLNLSNNMLTDINSSFFRFKELKILNLSNNIIKNVKLTDFEALRQLKTLDLSSNMIKRINIDLFNAMTLLENLYLSNNQLEILGNNGSSSLQSLTRIDLSNNKLKSLPKALFKHTKILYFSIEANELEGSIEKGMFEGVNETKLDLSYQFLTEIKDNAFFNLIRLETLLLNSNNIQTLSKMCFKTLINLQQLDLSNNQIINIDFNKDDLNNLHSLLLKNNYLAEINYEYFQHLSSLHFLDLSTNQISRFEPRSFLSLNNLIKLGIYNNRLEGTIETGTFDGLAFIPSLDISRNMLTTIQNASFNGMLQLLELNMSRGKISDLQYNAFINTEYIETLDLSYNKLEEFIVNTTDLSRVTTLFLNNNLIKVITIDSLYGLLQLRTIILSQNFINSIDNESLNSLDNLRHLDLSGNENLLFSVAILRENINLNTLILSRVKIRTNFSYISTDNILSELKLSNIGIENIRELGFGNMTHLNFLDLNTNNISKLQIGDFVGMCALLTLDLSFNQLKYIQPGVFKENTELKTLNISHNFLSTIEYGIFRGLIHLTVLDMSFNDINDLQTEKFYEVESLSQLIVDHNKIATLNAEDFTGTSLTKLSIGSNPLPCQTLVKLKKQNIPFQITAIRTDEHSNENVNGISCNKGMSLKPIFRAEQKEDNLDVINGLRYVLNTILKRNTEQNNTEYTYLEKISNVLENSNSAYNEKLSNLANMTSDVIAAGNNTNIMFKENNIMLNKIINLLNQTVAITLNISSIPQKEPFPFSSTYIPPIKNSSNGNQTVDVILYINKIKKELEDTIAIEKQNIKRIESQFAMNNNQNETSLPVNIERQQLLVSNKDNTKSLFTEICVALILSILLGFILYKFYKSKMNIRNRFSFSSRELPAAIENSDL